MSELGTIKSEQSWYERIKPLVEYVEYGSLKPGDMLIILLSKDQKDECKFRFVLAVNSPKILMLDSRQGLAWHYIPDGASTVRIFKRTI